MGKIIQRLKIAALASIVLTLWSWPIQEILALEFIVTSDHHSGYDKSQKTVWQAISENRFDRSSPN